MRGPSLFKTAAVLGVTMAMTTACLSGGGNSTSGGGGGSPSGQASGSTVTVAGTVDFQACDDKLCFVPESVPVIWTVTVR